MLHAGAKVLLQQLQDGLHARHVVRVAAHVDQHRAAERLRRLAGQLQHVLQHAAHVLRLDAIAARRRREAEQRTAATVATAAEQHEAVLQQLQQVQRADAVHAGEMSCVCGSCARIDGANAGSLLLALTYIRKQRPLASASVCGLPAAQNAKSSYFTPRSSANDTTNIDLNGSKKHANIHTNTLYTQLLRALFGTLRDLLLDTHHLHFV